MLVTQAVTTTAEEDSPMVAAVVSPPKRRTGCYYCLQPGHNWRQCPDRQQGKPPKNPANWETTPKKKKGKKRGRKLKDKSAAINMVGIKSSDSRIEELQYLPIQINGTAIDALLDLGAQVMAISKTLFDSLTEKADIVPTTTTLQCANGIEMEVIGETRILVEVPEAKTSVIISHS